MIAPQQQISLSILGAPSWMNATLSDKQVSMEIPDEDSYVEISTSLVLLLYDGAPAKPYSITLKASCEEIGRINGVQTEIFIPFTPKYYASIKLRPNDSIIKLSYDNISRSSFEVHCQGNRYSRIKPIIIEKPENINVSFTPEYLDLNTNQRGTFYLNITTNPKFKKNSTIKISATIEMIPLRDNLSINKPDYFISYDLIAPVEQKEEFSLPINFLLNILLIIIIIILFTYFKLIKR